MQTELYQTLRSVFDNHVFVVCRDGIFYEIVAATARHWTLVGAQPYADQMRIAQSGSECKELLRAGRIAARLA